MVGKTTKEIQKKVPKRKGAQRKVTMAYLDGGENNQRNVEKWIKFWDMPDRLPNKDEKIMRENKPWLRDFGVEAFICIYYA